MFSYQYLSIRLHNLCNVFLSSDRLRWCKNSKILILTQNRHKTRLMVFIFLLHSMNFRRLWSFRLIENSKYRKKLQLTVDFPFFTQKIKRGGLEENLWNHFMDLLFQLAMQYGPYYMVEIANSWHLSYSLIEWNRAVLVHKKMALWIKVFDPFNTSRSISVIPRKWIKGICPNV